MNSVVLALALVVAAPGLKDPPKKERPTIVGEWACTQCVGDGREFPKEMLSDIKLEFKADGTFRFEFGPQKGSGTYTSDTAKDPAELDYGDERIGKGNHAIFKIEKDTLTFCFAEGGRARPTAFESPASTRILLLTLTRVEKKKKE
jgi:uncharacterized protein (TIGR03067 family)